MRTLLKYAVLIVIIFVINIIALSKIIEASDKNNRWVFICNDIDQADMKYYYDSETVRYISDNQVNVWMKTVSPYNKPRLLHLEIACASSMFHLMENSVDFWGNRLSNFYIAGKWIMTPPDSEVYLLSKLVCKNLITSK
ncbi:MAG: hypothetical protein NT178_11395 [Proteobacteria bacterium]|nr:hypothetical protein [Pseudomonadota bacterium]